MNFLTDLNLEQLMYQEGYLSTSALLEAQQNITNIYGKVSQQMTSAKQSGLLFDVARFSEKDSTTSSFFDINLSCSSFCNFFSNAIAWSKTP
jgi:hypothetical protein